MYMKINIYILLSLLFLLNSCVNNSDNPTVKPGPPEEKVDFNHETIAGEWEIFYMEKTIQQKGLPSYSTYRYPERDGFTSKFYDGGKVTDSEGNLKPERGRFEERNVFGGLIISGEYELKVGSGGLNNQLMTYYKSKDTGKDTVVTVNIPGIYNKYFSLADDYQRITKIDKIVYNVQDLFFYRHKSRGADFNFPSTSKYAKANIINSNLLYGDWQFVSYWELRDGHKYSNEAYEKKYGEVVRFNKDGSFYAFSKNGYDDVALGGPGKYKVIDDVIQAYILDTTVEPNQEKSYLLWLKDKMYIQNSTYYFKEYNNYRDENNTLIDVVVQGTYKKIK